MLQRVELDINVYEAALKRTREIVQTFDHVFVSFSGGKDSLVALHIVKEVYKELEITEKIKVIFRDEELIPDDVIQFVQDIYHSGEFDFQYFCIPLRSEKFVLGDKQEYIQWDPNRKHIREVPEFAITEWTNVYDQYSSGPITTRYLPGRKCVITGIRADESLMRYQGIIAKKNKSFIAASKDPDIYMGRIIYDFSEMDIFRYLYEKEIEYCVTYDAQMFNGEALRVSTPIHSEAAKKLYKLKTNYPVFYDQIMNVFPDIELQARYFREFNRYGPLDNYSPTFEGIIKYLQDNLDPSMQPIAMKRVADCRKRRINNIANGKGRYGGYPVLYVFKAVINGQYKRKILPKKDSEITQKEIDFENNKTG
jgi:predicted phosphoadenosine phosphosulfate sulfurtransferase